jgi:CheY-like chemotaxis protein/nitrogen-specific signal transduction histidine kinase/HPt (histidine-containing phosphotransfer) domain-containing protein/uncharacterized protein YerC
MNISKFVKLAFPYCDSSIGELINGGMRFYESTDHRFNEFVEKHFDQVLSQDAFFVSGKETFISVSKESLYLFVLTETEPDIKEIHSIIDLCKQIIQLMDTYETYEYIFRKLPLVLAYKGLNQRYEIVTEITDKDYYPTLDTIVGKSVTEVYGEEEALNVFRLDNKAYKSNKFLRETIDIVSDKGKRKIDAIRMPVFRLSGQLKGVVSLGFDITEKEELVTLLKEYNLLQDLFLDIAQDLQSAPIEYYDESIQMMLQRLGKHLGADRAYIFEYMLDRNVMNNTHEWCAADVEPMIEHLQDVSILDFTEAWVYKHLNNETIIIDDIENLDHESALYQILEPQDIKSLMTMPIFLNNECIGFVGFDSVLRPTKWSKYKNHLDMLPKIVSSAMLRNQYEKSLVKERENAKEAMDAKSEFLAVMSHEIRTPLSGVFSALDLLDDALSKEEIDEYLGIARTSLESLSSIVNDVLDYSKIEAKKIKLNQSVVAFDQFVYDVVRPYQLTSIEKDIKLFIEYDNQIPNQLLADKGKVKQILDNLISNALKFTRDGSVKVCITLQSVDELYALIRFQVKDTGIGIDKENLKAIFDQFYRVDSSLSRATLGTGLGLSIVKELSQFLGGTISVDSEKGVGSTFTLDLPLMIKEKKRISTMKNVILFDSYGSSNDVAFFDQMFDLVLPVQTMEELNRINIDLYDLIVIVEREDTDYAALFGLDSISETNKQIVIIAEQFNRLKKMVINDPSVSLYLLPLISTQFETFLYQLKTKKKESKDKTVIPSSKTCLLVEDNVLNRKALTILIEKRGMKCVAVDNGFDAIEIAKERVFDFILMDLQMPSMDGFETTKRIRETDNRNTFTPILAVTANALPEHISKAATVGINEVFSKPLSKTMIDYIISQYAVKTEDIQSQDSGEDGIETFDYKRLEQDFHHKEIIDDVLETFLFDTEKNIQELRKAQVENERKQMRDIVHYLKSSFGYVYANKMVSLSKTILDRIETCTKLELEQLMKLYFNEYGKLLKEMKE